ncbi:hypothetical protein HGO34_15670 [Agrobacterium vitis]|uniref:hypothetical protein n=1 Tax=Agrobacterium vitis TaxID=373 RepID=UPI001F2C9E0A|nr:hypothetical protein [Agrobacterium vitis]MCF1498937.1 hypothetical protein [Allorhizobium sp. Av2]MCM2441160.1 hypothetical protein [Agrobacterium vitis]
MELPFGRVDIMSPPPISFKLSFGPGQKTTRVRITKKYPHSNKRQQARYARQIKAGQLFMRGCDRPSLNEHQR